VTGAPEHRRFIAPGSLKVAVGSANKGAEMSASSRHLGSLPARSVQFRCAGLVVLGLLAACQRRPPEPESENTPTKPAKKAAEIEAKPKAAAPRPDAKPSADPLAGKFALSDATQGLPPGKTLTATIDTDLGTLKCELFSDKAPITVANFVGLARGLRPFRDPSGSWVKRPAYDGTTFHRVIKGFMIQGGDPAGTGAGEPGYVIPDELWSGATHDKRGQLCMANRGPNTNGMQFFITDKAAPHLDRSYTIFGQCGPDSVMDKLVDVKVQGDRSLEPTKIKSVKISR
jgi:peptidyl-prolyl cis-trans isomerase A (cyclophilin A)